MVYATKMGCYNGKIAECVQRLCEINFGRYLARIYKLSVPGSYFFNVFFGNPSGIRSESFGNSRRIPEERTKKSRRKYEAGLIPNSIMPFSLAENFLQRLCSHSGIFFFNARILFPEIE